MEPPAERPAAAEPFGRQGTAGPGGSGSPDAGTGPAAPLPPARPWRVRPAVPGAILLAGHLAGAAPLWLARRAGGQVPAGPAAPGGALAGASPGPRAGTPGDGPRVGPADAPLGLALAVLPAPWPGGDGRGARPSPPPDPLHHELVRRLVAAWQEARPRPPLSCAWQAALARGGWPRAAAMALGGWRWVAGYPEAMGAGSEPLPAPAWPTPPVAEVAAGFAPLTGAEPTALARGLLLLWPAESPWEAQGAAALEWSWAARWQAEGDRALLAEALAVEAAWLAEWRRNLPVELPRDPRARARRDAGDLPPPGRDGGPAAQDPHRLVGRPGEPGPAHRVAGLLAGAARLGRFLLERGLGPDAVRRSAEELAACLRWAGVDPDRVPLWPAWHLALPVWGAWLPGAGPADLRELQAGLARQGWACCRLRPVAAGARLRLDPAPGRPPAQAGGLTGGIDA